MALSFRALWLRVLTAIWQCQAVSVDAACSKGHSFTPHIKQVLIFHSLQKNIKKGTGIFEPNAAQNVTGENVDVRTEPEYNQVLLNFEYKMSRLDKYRYIYLLRYKDIFIFFPKVQPYYL